MIKILSLLLACVITITFHIEAMSDSRKTHVIQLYNQIPQTMIPAIRPLLDEGDTITNFGNQIIISTAPANIPEIDELVTRLDKRMRNLLITVQNNQSGTDADTTEGAVGVYTDENIRIDTGEPLKQKGGLTISHDGIGYHKNESKTRRTQQIEQQIRAIEGNPAFIYTGESMNIPSRDRYGNIYTTEVDAKRGFYLVARLLDDNTVLLEVSLSNDTFDPDSQQTVVNTERLASTVSGSTGEWISLGSLRLGDDQKSSGLVKKITANESSLTGISIKVVPLD